MDWTPIIANAVAIVAPIAGTVIVTLIGIGIKRANAWLQSKVESERMRSALLQVSEATVAAVADLEKTVRPYMSDGKLTEDEQAQIKAAAMHRINTQVPYAVKALANAGMQDLEKFLNGRIELAVMTLPESTKPEAGEMRSEALLEKMI